MPVTSTAPAPQQPSVVGGSNLGVVGGSNLGSEVFGGLSSLKRKP
jgi:hypothetical protein